MNIFSYTHLFYFVFCLLFVIVFIKPSRIRELLPIAVISIIILTIVDIYIISTGLYQFNKPLFGFYGAPLFHLLWAGTAGIVFINYIRPGFSRKLVTIVFFTLITLSLEFIAEKAGVASRSGNYNPIHSALLDFGTLVILLWVSEGLYGDRIYRRQS